MTVNYTQLDKEAGVGLDYAALDRESGLDFDALDREADTSPQETPESPKAVSPTITPKIGDRPATGVTGAPTATTTPQRQIPGEPLSTKALRGAIKVIEGVQAVGKRVQYVNWKALQGLTFNAPDVIWAGLRKINPNLTKGMTMDEAVLSSAEYDPGKFMQFVGGMTEFVGRLRTGKAVGTKLGILAKPGDLPKSIGVAGKAFETAKLWGTAKLGKEMSTGLAQWIDPETDYQYEGAKGVMEDMAFGATVSVANQLILSPAFKAVAGTKFGQAVGKATEKAIVESSRFFPRTMDKILKAPSDHFKGQIEQYTEFVHKKLPKDYTPKERAAVNHAARYAQRQWTKAYNNYIKREIPDIIKRGVKPPVPKQLAIGKPVTTPPVTPKAEVKPPIETTAKATSIAQIKRHAVDIIPRKEEILSQLDEAIAKAPSGVGTVDAEKLHFDINGGANIYNTKEALQGFRDAVQKLPKKDYIGGKSRKKTARRKPVAGKDKPIKFIPTEDDTIFTDARIIVKGIMPKGSKINEGTRFGTKEEPITKKQTDAMLNTPTKPAEFVEYIIEASGAGVGVSYKPIADIGEGDTEPMALFKQKGKFYQYKQDLFNLITNRHKELSYGIADDGMLVAYIGGKPVASLIPMGEPTIKHPVAKLETKPLKPKPAKITRIGKPKPRGKPGFVDLTPIAEAGEQIAAKSIKAHKVVTRFTGVEAKVRKSLIEVEEQERQIPKIAAKESIKKFGRLSNKDSRAILDHLDNPKKFPTVPEHLRAQVEQVKKDQQEAKAILVELGYKADWPKGRIAYLQEELSTTTDPVKRGMITAALDELEGLGYVHHAYTTSLVGKVKRITGFGRKKISKRPAGLLGRKIPTLEAAEKAGLKVAHLSVGHAEMLAVARKAQLHNDLINAINKNKELAMPEKKAPEDWVFLDERVFPASQSRRSFVDKQGKTHIVTSRYKYQPALAEAIEELTWASKKNPLTRIYDKINNTMKHILFYNPVIMTKNDIFQGWRATGLGFVVKLPKAFISVAKKDAQYEEFRKAGLYNNVIDYAPAAKLLAENMLDFIQKSKGRVAAEFIGKRAINPFNLLKDLKFLNDKTTWKMDEVLRTAVAMDLTKGGMFGSFQKRTGLTKFETIELANDFMANYGKVPKHSRQVLNRVFFTPTYRVSMARMTAKMLASPKQFWPQLARHLAYKLFVWYILPGLVGAFVYGDWKTGRSEKGYKVVLRNPRTGLETVYSLSDPLLEEAKMTQRPVLQSLEYNLSAGLNLLIGLMRKPKYKNKRDKYGHLFKLGTPIIRDVVNMTDKDKTTAEKILTELAVAYVYKRRGGQQNEDNAAESFAKALSIWTDWKEQKKDIQKRF